MSAEATTTKLAIRPFRFTTSNEVLAHQEASRRLPTW
jgi:hypothetical protein